MRSIWVFLCFLATFPPALAQEPVIRVTSHLVQINVLVHEKHGEAARDLTRDDFSLLDDNRSRPLSVFAVSTAAPADAAAPAPNAASNRDPRPATATIILFDTLNTRGVGASGLIYAKKQLLDFLAHLRPGDPVALYALAGRDVQVIHEFTEDPQALISAAQGLSGTGAFGLGGRTGGQGSEFQTVREWLRVDRLGGGAPPEYTMRALEAVARHVAGVPGRKNLVWISAAFPISIGFSTGAMAAASRNALAKDGHGIVDHLDRGSTGPAPTMNELDPELKFYTKELRQTAKALNDVDLAVYPIDLTGLTTGRNRDAQWAAMDEIAAETGGRATYNTNDFEGGIRRALDDTRLTYTLGFYVPESDWDGRYHRLTVKVKASGVEVLSRRGYFAGDPPPESEADRAKALQFAAANPAEAVGIGVKVSAPQIPIEPGTREIVVTVGPSDLRFSHSDGRWRATVDMLFLQQTKNGRTVAGQRDDVEYALFPDNFAGAQKDGLVYKRTVEIAPGAARLRVVVRDAATGAVGSFSLPVAPPDAADRRAR